MSLLSASLHCLFGRLTAHRVAAMAMEPIPRELLVLLLIMVGAAGECGMQINQFKG